MTTIRLHQHPFAADPPEIIVVDSLAAWLIARINASPARLLRRIFRGAPTAGFDISRDVPALLAGDAPSYTVVELPGTGAEAFLAFQIILAGYSIASAFMAPKPDMPANVNRTQESPNNALGSRENQVRLMQRVEDIFGTVKAIPSLMMPTYTKYIDNIKVEYGYYCLGRGYYAIDTATIKDGDTPLGNITGASCAVYAPFVSPNNGGPFIQIGPAIIDSIVTVRRSVEIDGVTLKAANQIQLEASSGYVLLPAGAEYRNSGLYAPAAATDRVVQFWKRPNFNAVVTAGQTISITPPDLVQSRTGTVSVTAATLKFVDVNVISPSDPSVFDNLYVGATFAVSGFTAAGNNGTFVVATKPDVATVTVVSVPLVDEVATDDVTVQWHTMPAFAGARTVQEVGDGWLILNGASFPFAYNDPLDGSGPNTNIVANNGLTDWTDWIILATSDLREIWANVVALQGMNKNDGGLSQTTVYFDMEMQQLDGSLAPVGGVVTATGSVTGVTTAECAETLESVPPWTGFSRARMRRTTPYDYAFQGSVTDEIKWTDLYAVSPVNRAEFGNKTTLHTVTQATARSTAVKNRQLNCIASRLIPHWTGSAFTGGFDADGRHTWGTLQASAFLQDVIAAVTLDPKIGNRPFADLDMAQLQGVTDQLYAMHPEAPTFNYTFDSDSISFEETIETIANACFCKAFRQSGKIRLGLDRRQDYSFTVFNHRSKDPDYAETLERTWRNDADYDAVEFVYQDPGTLQAETIRLPLDGSGTKYKPFEIPGIRSFAQAWIRANREYRKLLGQRLSIETSCTTDARALLPNTRVDIVDNTRFKSFDGEIVGTSSDKLTLTLSQRIAFTAGEAHSIVLRRSDGSLQAITVTEVTGRTDQVHLAEAPTEDVKTETDRDGVATIFSFAADIRRGAQAFLVTEVEPPKDNYMVVRGVNYSPTYYEMDTQPIPPRDSVIN
ncbi:hypothetical protein BH10PSE18_BH10PSE18_15330 [soil metagenome]